MLLEFRTEVNVGRALKRARRSVCLIRQGPAGKKASNRRARQGRMLSHLCPALRLNNSASRACSQGEAFSSQNVSPSIANGILHKGFTTLSVGCKMWHVQCVCSFLHLLLLYLHLTGSRLRNLIQIIARTNLVGIVDSELWYLRINSSTATQLITRHVLFTCKHTSTEHPGLVHCLLRNASSSARSSLGIESRKPLVPDSLHGAPVWACDPDLIYCRALPS